MGAMAGEYATLRWSAHEHEHVPRDSNWYWALGILAACVALISVLFGNVLFAILILVAAATLGILATTPPPLIEFELSDRGIRVGGTMHRYEEVISFWVEDEHDDRPLLLVDTTKFLSPNLIIPIEEIDPHLIRSFLKEHAKEKPMHEPIGHKILEFLGL